MELEESKDVRSKILSEMLKDHRPPVSRRDFLSHGLIGFSAMTSLPTFMGWAKRVYAEDCGGSIETPIPFLVFDAAGGAALPANFLVGKEGGPEDLLKRYDQLGWNPLESGALDRSFGLPMGAKVSGIYKGIVSAASDDARKHLRLASFCHTATSDSQTNPLSSISLVMKSGVRGKMLPLGVGVINSVSGGNSAAALGDPALKPLAVKSVDDLANSLGVGAASPLGKLEPNQLVSFLRAGADLSRLQLKSYPATQQADLLKKLVQCAYIENEKMFGGGIVLDARLNANFREIYGITEGSASSLRSVVFGTLVMGSLMGSTGPSVLTIADCDYHNSTSEKGDLRDLEIGTEIGRSVEAAHRLKTPLFFQLITDGGCSNLPGTRVWVSDANDKCMTVVGYYRPEGVPKQRRVQIGSFTEGQGANREAVGGMGDSPFKVACAVFGNYLNVMRPGLNLESLYREFQKYVPQSPFKDEKEFESTLVFG